MGPILQPPGATRHPTLPLMVGHPSKAVRQTGCGEGPIRPPLTPPWTRGQQGRSHPSISAQPGPF